MKDDIKKFYIDHEKEILIGFGILVGMTIGVVAHKQYMNSALFLKVTDKNMLGLLNGGKLIYEIAQNDHQKIGLMVELASKNLA